MQVCLSVAGQTQLGTIPALRDEISSTNRPWPGILIHSETRSNPPTRFFVAEVGLKTPRLHLQVARGGDDPDGAGKWQTTLLEPTKIAARDGFALVVNGDFFKARNVSDGEGAKSGYHAGQWSLVSGPAMTDGRVWAVSPQPRPCLVIHTNQTVAIETLAAPGADNWEVLAGNDWLVRNGRVVASAGKARHPRTAVGINAAGDKLIILLVDGRKPGVAVGMTHQELASELVRQGCWQALNLDGGGSSVLAVRDAGTGKMTMLNVPTDGRERPVANVLGISYKPKNGSCSQRKKSSTTDRPGLLAW